MPFLNKTSAVKIIAAICIYIIAIIYQGYQYGQSDQSQIIPVIYEQDHPGTFSKDHYVNAYLNSGINERTIFHAMLRKIGYDIPWMVFLWHAIASITLILAWISIVGLFIKNHALQWLVIALILTLGFHTATGSNELYYNQFVPSLAAKAFASWGLYNWLQKKYHWWVILLIPAGFLQPLVGLQLFIVTSAALMVEHIRIKNLKTFPWVFIAIYIVTTLPWIYLLAINNGGQENPVAFIGILEFRLSHHFFGSYFDKIDLLFSLLFMITVIFFYQGKLKWMFVFIAIGVVFYEIGAELLKAPIIVYTQWWKTTLWVEAFAFIAIFSLVEKQFNLAEKFKKVSLAFLLAFLLFVAVYRLSGVMSERPLYMQPISHFKSDEEDISEQAQQLTDDRSLFVIPPDITAFRWYGKRSSYVDYKAMLHTEAFLYDWLVRMDDVYGYNSSTRSAGLNIYQQARKSLIDISSDKIEKWKALGITHLISYTDTLSGLELLGSNKSYAIYSLK